MTAASMSPEDPLETLRAHLRNAQAAAQQLIAEEQQCPPAGWQPLDSEQAQRTARQVRSLTELVHSIRERLPEDLLAQLADLIGALLNVLWALLDLLLSRLLPRPAGPDEPIEEIPIV